MSQRPGGLGRTALVLSTLLAAGALLLTACGASSQNAAVSSGTSPSVAPPDQVFGSSKSGQSANLGQDGVATSEIARGATDLGSPSPSATKLIVVNKTMRIETADVDRAIVRIRELVTRDGGDISSMQVATSADQPVYRDSVPLADGNVEQGSAPLRAYVTVRVPSAHYAAFVADAAKLGRVLTESESSDDVTQQHVDMRARLDNLEAEQGRLRRLFAKATSVKDMLAIEQELSRVQGEIESMKAQIDYLERQAARATVTLELTEPTAIVQPSGVDWGVRSALTDAIRAFVATMNGLIVLLGPVLAVLAFVGLPVALIVWLIVRGVRRRARTTAVAEESRDTSTDAPASPDETLS